MVTPTGIGRRLISETPLAVVDIETTGLYPGGDRVVELAIVRIDPGESPKLILDTLINPRRRVSATEIHGITDQDVADAPVFEEIAGNAVDALTDCVFASYNVYFDTKFLQDELSRAGVSGFPPYMCLMYLRPMLGLGSRCSLDDACRAHGIDRKGSHQAAVDALSAVSLWQLYRESLRERGIKTFGDIAKLKAYKFVDSFSIDPISRSMAASLRHATRLKSRSAFSPTAMRSSARDPREYLLREYWDALTAALADLTLTDDEIRYLDAKREALKLRQDELRWLHARAFSGIISDMSQDHAISAEEADTLQRVADGLRKLGWAPGDAPGVGVE